MKPREESQSLSWSLAWTALGLKRRIWAHMRISPHEPTGFQWLKKIITPKNTWILRKILIYHILCANLVLAIIRVIVWQKVFSDYTYRKTKSLEDVTLVIWLKYLSWTSFSIMNSQFLSFYRAKTARGHFFWKATLGPNLLRHICFVPESWIFQFTHDLPWHHYGHQQKSWLSRIRCGTL